MRTDTERHIIIRLPGKLIKTIKTSKMKKFKSFDPPKFSTQSGLYEGKMLGHSLNEFCANCGFPFGAHFDMSCPQTSNPDEHYWIPKGTYQTVKPLKNERRKTRQQ